MIKLFILILAWNHSYSSFDHIEFYSRYDCEKAIEQITSKAGRIFATCVEKDVPKKKFKCKINNNFTYSNYNSRGNPSAHNLDGYPYAEAIECEER